VEHTHVGCCVVSLADGCVLVCMRVMLRQVCASVCVFVWRDDDMAQHELSGGARRDVLMSRLGC
jgi:hypothetical protein